jgi:large subunit ribosomal protein L23
MPANVAAMYIVKHPLLSEKNTDQMTDHKRYTFLVDPRATKTEIKKAVEELYKVRVENVSTQIRKGGLRRMKYGAVESPVTKKATVKLHPDDSIELF